MDQCPTNPNQPLETLPLEIQGSSSDNAPALSEAISFLSTGRFSIESPEMETSIISNNTSNPHCSSDHQDLVIYAQQHFWEEDNLLEESESSAMQTQHQSVKRPRSQPTSPGRVAKILAQPTDPDTSLISAISDASEESATAVSVTTTETLPPQLQQSARQRPSRFPTEAPSLPERNPPARTPATTAQFCQFLREFRASLSRGLDDILLGSKRPAELEILRPSLEGLVSTVAIALVGLEKSLQVLLTPSELPLPAGAPLLLPTPPHLPAESLGVETSLMDRVPPPLDFPTPRQPPTLGPHPVSASSWAKVVARSQERTPLTRTQPIALATPQPATSSDSHGSLPPDGPPTNRGRSSRPLTARQCQRQTQPSLPLPPPTRRGLRALLAISRSPTDAPAAPPAAEAIQKVLFAETVVPAPGAMETEAAAPARSKKADEPVTYLHVTCPNFSAAARREPREAWRLLLLTKSKEGSPRLRPLDILPVSASAAEIFILESQLPVYREALQDFLVDPPPPLTEAADFRRRTTAYRNSYFKSYRMATLQGFSPDLRADFLFALWNEVLSPTGPPPSKYKDLRWIVKQDLRESNLLSESADL